MVKWSMLPCSFPLLQGNCTGWFARIPRKYNHLDAHSVLLHQPLTKEELTKVQINHAISNQTYGR